MRATESVLFGRWESVDADDEQRRSMGRVIQEFFPGGVLLYAARRNGETVVIELSYELDGEWLVTNQPSAPRTERTRIHVNEHGQLVVGSGPDQTVFNRAPNATFT